MSSPDTPEHDSVDNLLTVRGPLRGDRVRGQVLAQTTSVVRRRCVVRRLGWAAGLAVCYLAGIMTVWGWAAASIPRDATVIEQPAPLDAKPGEGIRPAPEQPRSPGVRRPRPARPPHSGQVGIARAGFEQIRQVSDRYLYEQGDIAKALHYYTRALDQATPDQREISLAQDSWLLMALKEARRKEHPNENGGT